VKQVFKEVPEPWFVAIIGSRSNPSCWRMTASSANAGTENATNAAF
jgi:hypothetical protein